MSNRDAGNECDLCNGIGKWGKSYCVYCNGTGEWNLAAQSYVNNHVCQCIMLDRKYCPVCKKSCHHDTSLNPKQTIDPGYGGIAGKSGGTVKDMPDIIA